MSSRQSGGNNTLFNYFTKVPSVSNGKQRENNDSNLVTPKKTKDKRRLSVSKDDDENIQPVKRRKRIIENSDSSDDESNKDISLNSIKSEYVSTPKKIAKQTMLKEKPKEKDYTENVPSESTDQETWLHNKLVFLKPKLIADKNRRPASHPEYDPRTLYVPGDFLSKQTPAMQQWWLLKSDHFDCVLFFKVGKFYELYHMDAVTGVNELGLSFMRGEFAHSGFPESAYGRMASSLVELGYKVARVEQTETPDAMQKRLNATPKGSKQSKVVSRELCQITNKATRIQGNQDVDIKNPYSLYLLAILEKRNKNQIEFGVCFIDTSIGIFHIGQFKDDNRFSRLLTMIAQYPPIVLLEERQQLNSETKFILKTAVGSSIESLNSSSQFYNSNKTLEIIKQYFPRLKNDELNIPDAIKEVLYPDDILCTTVKEEYDLAVRCLGACIWYLKDCLLDVQLLSLCKYELFVPTDKTMKNSCKYMVLDACTLSSLNILGQEETLESTLDNCCTLFGKRLLHQWICKPLCNVEEIRSRQEAISEYLCNQQLLHDTREILSDLPDLERLINRIHFLGNAKRAVNHPDSRAILYEEKTYSKKKIQDFIQVLNGFEKAMQLEELFADVSSKMLKTHSNFNKNAGLLEVIQNLKSSFNLEEAKKEGKIIPNYGAYEEFDSTIDDIRSIESELEEYLESQRQFFGCDVTYFGSDKKRYQLDVPERATHKVNHKYHLEGTKKGSKPSKRYTTAETKELLSRMMAAEARSKEVLHDLNRKVFERFSEKYDNWCSVCYSISVIDVLASLAEYAKNLSSDVCIPEVLPFSSSPQLIIKNGIHPYIPNIENFVPNDTELGTENHSSVLILTGPNMGGKSTLMRQVALLTIMAQLGCHLPASEMKITLVDRIFTRLGAHDDIMAGNSTFLVELQEALSILQHSTKNSLVFLDELGRGTSTYDGTAIAIAYVDKLIHVNCRSIFSTHYYSLVDYFKNVTTIQLCHMACKVESDEDDVTQETVIFMYKMIGGPCPKSYGFNAARLAGIPSVITNRAHQISQKVEAETISRKVFRKVFREGQIIMLSDVI